jgi:hypothetical protein
VVGLGQLLTGHDGVEVCRPGERVAGVMHDTLEVVGLAKGIDVRGRHRVEVIFLA